MKTTLYQWAIAYLDHSRSRYVYKTYHEKRLAFQYFFRSFDPNIYPDDLYKGGVLVYFERLSQVRSSNSANKDRKNLLAAWNWAAQYIPDWPQNSPFQVHKLPEQRFPRYVPPEEDFWKVFSLAESEQDRLMLLCYFHLAARRNEIFQLRKEDVDMHRKKVRLHTRKTKGGSMRSDWLPMTKQLHELFQKHLPGLPGIWCFPDPQTGLPYIARQQWLARLCAAADVPKFGLHAIRHLSASILVDSKIPLPEVQAVLRHSNLTTTQRYVHRMNTGSCLSSVFDKISDCKVLASPLS